MKVLRGAHSVTPCDCNYIVLSILNQGEGQNCNFG